MTSQSRVCRNLFILVMVFLSFSCKLNIETSHYCQDVFPTYSFHRLMLTFYSFLGRYFQLLSRLTERGLSEQCGSGLGFGVVVYNLLCQRLNLKVREYL